MRRATWSLALAVCSWHRLAQLNKAKAKQGGGNDPGGPQPGPYGYGVSTSTVSIGPIILSVSHSWSLRLAISTVL